MQITARYAHDGMARGVTDFGKSSPTGQRVAEKRMQVVTKRKRRTLDQ